MSTNGMARFRHILFAHLKTSSGGLAVAALCLLGAILAEMAAPWPIKFIFDHVLLERPLSSGLAALTPEFLHDRRAALIALSASIFALVLVSGALAYVQLYITARVGHELTYVLRKHLFMRLQAMSPTPAAGQGAGELLVKFAADTTVVKDVVADWLLTLASHIVLVACMLSIMFYINWRLALVVASILPVLGLVLYQLNRRIRRSLAAQRHQEGHMASRVGEMLTSLKVVQIFGRESHESRRFDDTSARNLSEGVRTSRETAAVAKAIALVSAGAMSLTVLVGAHQVLLEQMSPGDLLVFMAYLRSLFKPLRHLGKLSVKFSRAAVSARRIGEILALEPASPDRPDARDAVDLRGAIAFEGVRFGYESGTDVLCNVSFRIRAGERVAIVGPSGAGKSTVIGLLARLHDPRAGRITIDGIDVRDFRRESLRSEIGVVLQDTLLFGASIRENIAYGRPESSPAEIEAAARQAYAHEFIEQLPLGYETIVAERGDTLSGGQRQRICLARALVKQPAILILDEPTTAVDAESARLIDAAIRRSRAGKTTIVISHQLGTMSGFDCVFVLKAGRIAAQGRRTDLARDMSGTIKGPRVRSA